MSTLYLDAECQTDLSDSKERTRLLYAIQTGAFKFTRHLCCKKVSLHNSAARPTFKTLYVLLVF